MYQKVNNTNKTGFSYDLQGLAYAIFLLVNHFSAKFCVSVQMGLSDHDDPVNEKPSGQVKVNPFQRKTEVRKEITVPQIWGFLFPCDIIRDKGFIIQLFSYSSLSALYQHNVF